MVKHLSALKDAKLERGLFKRRTFGIALAMVCLVILLISRLCYLQLAQYRTYTTLAQQNQLGLFPIQPNRGLIYDRNNKLLAENVPAYELDITPSLVPDLADTLNRLSKVIAISDDDRKEFNRELKLHRSFQPIPLRTKLSEQEVASFSVEQYRFQGVAIQADMIRHYLMGPEFAAVLGYVGRINAQELAKVDPTNYSATNFIGKTGVEKHYEQLLHGVVGYQQVETNADGQILRVIKRTPSIAGQDLHLTLDANLQEAAYNALQGERGALVAIDPQTGAILALVSTPSYDPNLFATGISQDDYDALQNTPGQPLYNRALRGQFPPGSTIKPFMGLEGLISNTITPDFTIFDPGWYQLKNSTHIYHDMLRTGHGTVDLTKAITESCDVYFYTLAFKLGIEHIDTILQRFGFGAPTGIDLDEASGLVPSPEWKSKKMRKSWYPGDTLITGIGQGFMLVTPLQLAEGVATLAMRGQRWVPHVLQQQPVPLPPVATTEDNWNVILNAMQNVTQENDGTAFRYFQGAQYSVAAKTGTAQVFSLRQNERYHANMLPVSLRDNALFIAFAPTDKPTIALAVVIQNSPVHAAQIARQVLDAYFNVPAKPAEVAKS